LKEANSVELPAVRPGSETRTRRQVVVSVAIILAVMALILFAVPRPEGIKPAGWRLLAIFAGTILALMLRPLPGGAAVLLGITAIIATGTLPLGKALSGYSDSNAWLILSAFFIGRGLIKAGLARRIALYFVRRIGQSSLGLAYSVIFSDVILACVIPSNAARSEVATSGTRSNVPPDAVRIIRVASGDLKPTSFAVTASIDIPSGGNASITTLALGTSSSRLGRSRP
jgi:di/tricarboxylate transporter